MQLSGIGNSVNAAQFTSSPGTNAEEAAEIRNGATEGGRGAAANAVKTAEQDRGIGTSIDLRA